MNEKPWIPLVAIAVFLAALTNAVDGQSKSAGARVGGNIAPNGNEIQVDLPAQHHLRNAGGSDTKGLCVFTSLDMAARWANVRALIGFRDWMKRYPGGGYPEKVDRKIAEICKERGLAKPRYIQVEGADLELIKLATKCGRMVCSTYDRSPTGRYGGRRIYHMVNIAHATDAWFAVLDNNSPGTDKYEWMTPAEFTRVCASGGKPWIVILLEPGPPPSPTN